MTYAPKFLVPDSIDDDDDEQQDPVSPVSRSMRRSFHSGKMTADSATLKYHDREVYSRGLGELEGSLPLTLAQEWERNESWEAHDGLRFTAAAEYDYVLGAAGAIPAEHAQTFSLETSAGTRDEGSKGQTLADFVAAINQHVADRLTQKGMALEPERHLLTEEEVIAIRLYTGPGYQPINTFLREMGNLSSPMRHRLARSASNATIEHPAHPDSH